MTSSNTKRSFFLLASFDPGRFYIPILVLFGLILRLAIVCREDFYLERDSLFYIRLVGVFDLGKFSRGIDAYPGPLFIVILKAINILLPSHTIVAALTLNILISVAGSVVFYMILKELDLKYSKILALLFATHPVIIRNSCQILREPVYLTFMMLCGYFIIVAMKRDRYPLLAPAGFCSLIAFLFRYEAGEIWLLFPLLLYPCIVPAVPGGRFRRAVKAAAFFYLPILLTGLLLLVGYPVLLSFITRRIYFFVHRIMH